MSSRKTIHKRIPSRNLIISPISYTPSSDFELLSVSEAKRRNPIKVGQLTKVGQKRSTWRKRLFFLIGTKLYYFRSTNAKSWAGALDVRNARVTRADKECKKRHVMKVETKERTLYAHGISEDDINQWVMVIEQAAESCLTVRKDVTAMDTQHNVFSTIQEAIDAAEEEDHILVWPGVYEETLILDKPVHIEGVSQVPSVHDKTESLTLTEEQDQEQIMEQMERQESEQRPEQEKESISMEGQESNAELQTWTDPSTFVEMYSDSTDIVFDLEEYDSDDEDEDGDGDDECVREERDEKEEQSSTKEQEGEATTISDEAESVSEKSGVTGSNSGVVIISRDDCCVAYKTKGAVFTNIEMRVEVSDEKIDEETISVLEVENGHVALENCTLSSNAGCGVLAMNRSACQIDKCLIVDNRDVGVWLWDKTRVEIRNSKVKRSGFDGIRLTAESQCIVRDTRIHKCKLHGIAVCDKSKCLIESNRIISCAAVGVRLSQECNVTLRDNEISKCGEYGIHCTDSVVGHVEQNNRLVDNAMAVLFCEPDESTIRRTMQLDIEPIPGV